MSTKKLQIIGNFIKVDETLTQAGLAADAKVTGDAINQIQAGIDEVVYLVGGSSVADQIAGKADAEHYHDDRYYTEVEIDNKISELNTSIDEKSDIEHMHAIVDIIDLQSELDSKYEKPSDGIPAADLTADVQESLNKANTAIQSLDGYATEGYVAEAIAAIPEFDPSEFQAAIDGKADFDHDHNDVYYTETEIDAKLGSMQSDIDSKVDAIDGMGLSTNDFTTAYKDKLDTIEPDANHYEHPVHTSYDSGLYKVAVDGSGHVSGATLVEKDDIVALGIPAQDTTYATEISDLSDRIDGVEGSINTTNETLNGVSQALESYKTTNNTAVATNTSGIQANKTAIEEIQGDYLTSTDKTQLQDDITKVSDKATTNASAIAVLNGEGEGSVKQSIDNAFNEFAANVSNDGVVNTYKELIDYAAAHGPEFTTLVGRVDTIETHVNDVDANLSEYKTEVSERFTETDTIMNGHIANTENPHGVTKEQIGLGNVDNTADLDKPVSYAIQAALDEKADFEHIHDDATTGASGFMSAEDKSQLIDLQTKVGDTSVSDQITSAIAEHVDASGNIVYTQSDEPVDAEEGSVWVDMSVESVNQVIFVSDENLVIGTQFAAVISSETLFM